MTELAKRTTAAAAFRSLSSPYRDKIERADAARGKLEGRLRRAFDLWEQEMRELWGPEETPPDGGHAANAEGVA